MAITRLGLYGGPRAGLSGDDVLNANDIESASEVSTPSLGQVHVLTAVSIESASEVTNPTVTEGNHLLLAEDIESASEVSTPTLAEIHVLTAVSIESTSEVSNPTLAEAKDDLLADDIESQSEVSSPTLGQTHVLLADDVESRSEVSSPTLDRVAEVVKPKKGGRVGRKRYAVEVDGELIQVASISDVEAILAQVRELANESAEKDVQTPIAPKPPRISVKTASGNRTTSKIIQREVRRTQSVVSAAYQRRAKDISQDVEISQLIQKRIESDEQDDEQAAVILLM